MLQDLRDSLNRCILQSFMDDFLLDPWYSSGPLPLLHIERVCDELGSSLFVASLFVGDPLSAMQEHMQRLNIAKVRMDQFISVCGVDDAVRVTDDVLPLWESAVQMHRVTDLSGAMGEYKFLEQILSLSDPLKLKDAVKLCHNRNQYVGVCRLYSDALDTAVGFLSKQIEIVEDKNFLLLA